MNLTKRTPASEVPRSPPGIEKSQELREAKPLFRNSHQTTSTPFRFFAQNGDTGRSINTHKRRTPRRRRESGRKGRGCHREDRPLVSELENRTKEATWGERDEEARRSSKKLEEKEEEREKERQRERVDGRNVEKLHPAHCIEIQEKEERLRQKRDDGAEGWRRKESGVGRQGGGWRRGRARRGAFLESSGRRK